MKKIVLLFAVAVLAGGMAWAQWPDPNPPDGGEGLRGRVNTAVVPAMGTETLNTAGRYTSAADIAINPRFFNSNLEGTFMFLGGNVGLNPDVGPNSDPTRIDLLFARTIGGIYVGFYFGGGFVDALGGRTQENTPGADPDDLEDRRGRYTEWDTNLALLIGIANMGIRVDFGLRGDGSNSSAEGNDWDETERVRNAGPTFSVTWGMNQGDLRPFARVGLRVADSTRSEESRSSPDFDSESRVTTGGALDITAGVRYIIDPVTAVGGELWFGTRFRDRNRGSETDEDDWDNRYAGSLTGVGMFLYYQQRFDGERGGFGIRPTMNLGVSWTNRNEDRDPGEPGDWQVIGDRWFTLNAGLDVGARWQATERITLLTGVTTRFFQWTTWSETGSNTYGTSPYPEAENSSWRFDGINLHNFNIGMTLAASESVTLGLRLNSLIDGLFGTQFRPTFDFTVTALVGNN